MDAFTIAKIFALLLITFTGIYLLVSGQNEEKDFKNLSKILGDPQYRASFQDIFADTNDNIGKVSIAFYSGLFAYQGWNYLNFIIEELQNPKRFFKLKLGREGLLLYFLTN